MDRQKLIDAAYASAETFNILGGPGSGNFGHAGRPGKRGGSAKGGGKREPGADAFEGSVYFNPDEEPGFQFSEINAGLDSYGAKVVVVSGGGGGWLGAAVVDVGSADAFEKEAERKIDKEEDWALENLDTTWDWGEMPDLDSIASAVERYGAKMTFDESKGDWLEVKIKKGKK